MIKVIQKRFEKLVDGIFKIAVLSWILMVILAVMNKQAAALYEWPFLTYSAAIYGLKLFFSTPKKEG